MKRARLDEAGSLIFSAGQGSVVKSSVASTF